MITNIQRFSLHDGPGIRTIIFLKGCPLRCLWCDNPECVAPGPQLGLIKAFCNRCGDCFQSCPEGAISPSEENEPKIDRDRCTNCGQCAAVCLPKALVTYGQEMSAKEAIKVAERDRNFYVGSGGGLTVSSGEPLFHPAFLGELLELGKAAGLHTAIETSGFATKQVLQHVLPLLDYVLFDLKHLDSSVHRQVTGVPNEPILENARLVAASGLPVQFRCPLIPTINDTPDNIAQTAAFLSDIQGASAAIELLPYHRFGQGKYDALDSPYPLPDLQPFEQPRIIAIQRAYEELGVRCSVSA